jgi:hypothetical protein
MTKEQLIEMRDGIAGTHADSPLGIEVLKKDLDDYACASLIVLMKQVIPEKYVDEIIENIEKLAKADKENL